jgi:hypothetical protein
VKRSRIKRRARPEEQTERIYGSDDRREWMTRQPCIFCGKRPSVSAHIRGGGTGRKADASETAPMCTKCHDGYDGRVKAGGRATFLAEIGWTFERVVAAAELVQLRFEAYVLASGRLAF